MSTYQIISTQYLTAHLLHFGRSGLDVNVGIISSQLLWKEKMPPIVTSPSLLSWGLSGGPHNLHGGSAALTIVNKSHV